jgi:hypothetical protein
MKHAHTQQRLLAAVAKGEVSESAGRPGLADLVAPVVDATNKVHGILHQYTAIALDG